MKKCTYGIISDVKADKVSGLIGEILEENPLHHHFIQSALSNITQEEIEYLDTYLGFCLDKGHSIPYLASCYLTIVEDTLREQIYFKRNNEYRHKSFSEVANNVYYDENYMNRYMYGLALTSFLWPNHVGLARFFKETLPRQKGGRYLEVGPGHGYNLMTAMLNCSFDSFLGVDISKASIKQTYEIVEYFHPEKKKYLKLQQADFLTAEQLEENSFDAIVMGEVLEHVEQPESFLQRIVELAKNDSYIYITTCINAPAVDHIYLWRDTDELEEMIRNNGLNIKNHLYLPYSGTSCEESIQNGLAVNIAYVLEKL